MEGEGSLAATMSAADIRPDMQQFDSSGTSGEELDYSNEQSPNGEDMTPVSTASGHIVWTPGTSMFSSMSSRSSAREPPSLVTNGLHSAQRSSRPGAVRQPSNAYAPQRRPNQYITHASSRQRQGSTHRMRRNPEAAYKAQERAYVNKVRQDAQENEFFDVSRTPSLGDYSSDTEESDAARSVNEFADNDGYDQELLIFYDNEDMEPSVEEMKIPANKERLEWHAMLANVLTGDVVKQEKKRLIAGAETQNDDVRKAEIWTGVRAKACGRTVAFQKSIVENARASVRAEIDSVIAFEIKGEAEAGKTASEQVQDIVKRIEKIESLYPTRLALEAAHPNAATPAYADMCATVFSWYNTTEMINVQLSILQKWVGNLELDLTKPRARSEDDHEGQLFDDSSFIDRILKEDGLKSLQGDKSILKAVNAVIQKAKETFIINADAYAERHLPPYIEELLTLINFPSRLIQEIIRVRLGYASKVKDATQGGGILMAEQMLLQFQILLKVAVSIKEAYIQIAHQENGWELPPCIDDAFDSDVIEALKFYFKMLNWKLSANKNTFKEAEILEQEWEFSNQLGRYVEGGDVEVAEQFSMLTSRSLVRLTQSFGSELTRRPDEVAGAEMDKRYKAIFDSVRVRQRKIFRFSRILGQRFENSTEYNINIDQGAFQELLDELAMSGHSLVNAKSAAGDNTDLTIIVCPNLIDRVKDIESMLGTCYHAEDAPEDTTNPYVLILKPEHPIVWAGNRIQSEIRHPHLELKMGRLRLVADGSQQRLVAANSAFIARTGIDLAVLVDMRANLPRVYQELHKIRKTAYKLSESIMDSVQIVRKQTAGLQCQELIQTCFAFATEFGQRSAIYMDPQRRAMHQMKLTNIALDWVSFICDDCVASDRKTFRWAVVALEFAMMMTRGQSILTITEDEYATLRAKVAGCMSLLISHFDIMGARSTVAALAEKQKYESAFGKKLESSRLKDDDESSKLVRAQRVEEIERMDQQRKDKEVDRQALGRVLETSNEADRALTQLSASAGNVHMRWQQGQFVGGGTFGSVYVAINLDSTQIMAVKEIRLQDPKLIPTVVSQIRDEMSVLQVLDHPNIVQYYGIEPHRDKVYIFMEYCSGGSLATLLEHGRIQEEDFIQVYAFQMLEGLAYLHEANVVHRDIKPENILLDHNGVIKFVDFGAAKVIAKQSKTIVAEGPNGKGGRQNSVQGTPMYMSPEVIRGGKNHHARLGAEDIWSLGCVISEMATGSRPWSSMDNEWAIMYNIAQGHSPQMPTREQMSDCGLDFLKRCFERDPIKRASAAELLQHDWISAIRAQWSLEPSTPQTPASSASPNTLSRESTQPE